MADRRDEVVGSSNNHDVNNHCAADPKQDRENHSSSAGKDSKNHVTVVPNASGKESLMAKNSCDEDKGENSAVLPSNISETNKDSSFGQNDSGVKVDLESDIVDSSSGVKYGASNSQARTDEIVNKTAAKLASDCSMIPFPETSSADPHHHSDCSSSSRSSKDIFMDAQEDISNDSSKHTGNGDLSMSQKDDSGIDFERTPETSKSTKKANDHDESGSSDLMAQFKEELDNFYSSLPSGSSNRDKPSAADACAGDVDTSSDTGNAASNDVEELSLSDLQDFASTIRTRKKVRNRRRLSSSSSSSSSTTEGPDEEASDEDNKKSSDEEEEVMETGNDRVPSAKWHPILQTRKREIGISNTVPLSYMFARKTNCSLSLVQRLKLLHKLEHHDGCVNALHFNKSGTLLASGSDDWNIVLWHWNQNKPYFVFESGHRSNVFQAKFMPYSGDTHIVSCARDGMVRLAELSSTGVCKGTRKLAQHKGAAHKLAIQQDASHLFYSCGEDAVIFEVDLRQDKANKLCKTKENQKNIALYSIHANPFKSFEFVVGGRDHYVRIYDKRMLSENDANPVKKFCPHHLIDSDIKANVTCAVYNYNGTEVLGTYNDEDIYLFDNDHSDGADFIKRYKGHRNNATVKGVNFYGPHSEYVVSGSDCGNVYLWDKETEKCVQYFHGDDGGVVNVLEPHPHLPILATSGLDDDVKVWAPTAQNPTDLSGLEDVIRRNWTERREERIYMEDAVRMDTDMYWRLIHHMDRAVRRNARRQGLEVSTSSSNSDSDEGDSENWFM